MSVTEPTELAGVHPQWGQRILLLANITDEQCLCYRHYSKAFSTVAFNLEVMKTAVASTVALRDRAERGTPSSLPQH